MSLSRTQCSRRAAEINSLIKRELRSDKVGSGMTHNTLSSGPRVSQVVYRRVECILSIRYFLLYNTTHYSLLYILSSSD